MARHAFSCLGVLEWLHWFGWNISTYRARTAGLGSNQRYFEVDYEFIKWPSSQSMYNQKLGHQRPKTSFLLWKPLRKCMNLIKIGWKTQKRFQKLNFHENIFNLIPFPAILHNLIIKSSEIECDPWWFFKEKNDFSKKLGVIHLFRVLYFFKINVVSLE